MFVDLYFTPYITTKHNNNNGMRHETVRVDHTIDSTFHQNGSDGTEAVAVVMIEKYGFESHFSLPFCFPFYFVFFFFYFTVMMRVTVQ